MTDPDITWAISANVAWRLPEVNIGIVCANAPALRPLYLFLRGRLDTERTKQASHSGRSGRSGATSKEKFALPSNTRWGAHSATLQGSGDEGSHSGILGGKKLSADEGVELEMGMPIRDLSPSGGLTGRKEVWA